MTQIFTIGHSTHSKQNFADMLINNDVYRLIDIRSYPGSRHVPHFNKDEMKEWLPKFDIEYIHLKDLGGRRYTCICDQTDTNAWWSHKAFRSYADYALTLPFQKGFDQLKRLAEEKTTAIMCSEVQWWKCHRRIVTDYLLMNDFDVFHIMSKTLTKPAEITRSAKKEPTGQIHYPIICKEVTQYDLFSN